MDASIKELLYNRRTTNRVKRQPTEWEKTFSRYSSGGGLISKKYKELKN
jgi:hypothetical protein